MHSELPIPVTRSEQLHMLACDKVLHHPFLERGEFLQVTGWPTDLYDEFMAMTPTQQMDLVNSWRAQDDAKFEDTLRQSRVRALNKLVDIMDDDDASVSQKANVAQFIVRSSGTILKPTEAPSRESQNLDYERITRDENKKEQERLSVRYAKTHS